jgi:hypothetical protein
MCPVPLYEGLEALLRIYSIRDSYKGDYRPEDKKAMLSDFTEMEQYLRKYIGLAKEYYTGKKIQNQENEISVMKPDAEIGKRSRKQCREYRQKGIAERQRMLEPEHKKWLSIARKLRSKQPKWSLRAIAINIHENLEINDNLSYRNGKPSFQTVYKYLLKNTV